ncbi:MAG: carboxypeptidase-like regulatory domain-containing protein [Chryseolinea sp.]
MKNSLHLSIEKPCDENWEEFTPQTNGRFCPTCEKTVIDFSKLSDQAILDFFTNKPARTCGRFRTNQLKSYSLDSIATISPGRALLKAGFLSLMFVLTIQQSYAQGEVSAKATSELTTGHQTPVGDNVSIRPGEYFSGIVKDEDGNALPAVNVLLKGTDKGTSTDAEGRFSFPVQLKVGDVLLFSFVGYETVEYTIASTDETVIEMKMEYEIMMGTVAVAGCYQPKETLWSKIKSLF